jgi:hypothetical protein
MGDARLCSPDLLPYRLRNGVSFLLSSAVRLKAQEPPRRCGSHLVVASHAFIG